MKMKNKIIIINILLIIINMLNYNVFAQIIELQNPLPTFCNLNDVFFFSKDTGIIVGDKGSILLTNNAGKDWNKINYEKDYNLNCVFFINKSLGWTCGSLKLLKTTNGGNSWSEIPFNRGGAGLGLRAMFFINENIGWCTGGGGIVYKTINGGADWDSLYLGDSSPQINPFCTFNTIHFIDSLNGYIGGNDGYDNGFLFNTIDGGSSWQKVDNFQENTITYIKLFNLNKIYLVSKYKPSNYNWFYKTENSFSDYYKYYYSINGIDKTAINKMAFIDSLNGIAVGSYANIARIYKTVNGGLSWNCVFDPIKSFSLTSVCIADGNTFYAVGEKGIILESIDTGNTWQYKSKGAHLMERIQKIKFLDSLNGWACGLSGEVLIKTSDGGKNWEKSILPSGTGGNFNDIYFINNNIGWICGGSILLKTEDGGVSWLKNTNIIGGNYTEMYFYNDTSFIILASSYIYKTNDNGNSWLTVPFNYDISISATSFSCSNNKCWINTTSNTFFSEDYGNSWVNLEEKRLVFNFVDSITFSILWNNNEKVLQRTNNYGATWEFVSNNIPYNNIYVVSKDTLYAINKNFFYSYNGGESWDSIIIPFSNENLYTMSFINNNQGWFAGQYGIIYRYSNLLNSIDSFNGLMDSNFIISPNPTNNELNLSNINNRENTVLIFNSNGYCCYYKKNVINNFKIDITTFKSGVYLILLQTKEKKQSLKFIKL